MSAKNDFWKPSVPHNPGRKKIGNKNAKPTTDSRAQLAKKPLTPSGIGVAFIATGSGLLTTFGAVD
jgi:hypothetical protein